MSTSHRFWPSVTGTAPSHAGLARPVSIVRRRRLRDISEPITFDHRLNVEVALRILGSQGQAMAFVPIPRGRSGVVSADDLRFAREWAGRRATVAHAVTQVVIDCEPDRPFAGIDPDKTV